MESILNFYVNQSPITDPGDYGFLYDDLPEEPAALIEVISGLLLHYWAAQDMKLQLGREQRHEQHLRTARERLTQMYKHDPSSLTIPRSPANRQICRCRDFAVLLVSMLRHKKVPARMRVGFENYFTGEIFYGDHWIAEFWDSNQKKWRLIDPDIGGADLELLQRTIKRPLKPGLDFTDLRREIDYMVAGRMWDRVRAHEIKPDLCRATKTWKGWPVIRGNLLHDFQGLNRLEMGLFDYWDELHYKPETEVNVRDRALLDQIATLTQQADETFAEMRRLFEELPRTYLIRSRLRLLGVIGNGDMETAEDLQQSDMSKLIALTEEAGLREMDADQSAPASNAQQKPEPRPFAAYDSSKEIIVLGARQNNLKNIDIHIPRNKFVVITGVSGSGKSSLAFDTIYAEGQRRYMESLSSFARQFMKQMEKPNVEKIIGLNPTVAIEQRVINPNSRSTVGSITEVIDYLRVLFARVGQMHCPQCGRAISVQSAQQITSRLMKLPPGTRILVLSPFGQHSQKETAQLLGEAKARGYLHARVNGAWISLQEEMSFKVPEADIVEVLVADLHLKAGDDFAAFLPVVEEAITTGNGILAVIADGEEYRLSGSEVCPHCGIYLPKLEPRLLNPNTPYGMCPECHGLGVELQVDPDLIISRPERSLLDDASDFHFFHNLRKSTSQYWVGLIKGFAEHFGADLEQPWKDLPQEFREAMIFGTDEKIPWDYEAEDGSLSIRRKRGFTGAVANINRLYRATKSESQRQRYLQFMSKQPCQACNGEKLSRDARYISLAGKRFPEITQLSIGNLLIWVRDLRAGLSKQQIEIGNEILNEMEQRLQIICDVGLHYLTLDRPAPTLSGGEAQRIRLAGQVGAELIGILYILDEPSIGLHPHNQRALLELLKRLRDLGNTILVVEHDAETMLTADWLIDLGPGAGSFGGELIAAGTPEEVIANPRSLTGMYLSGEKRITSQHDYRHRTPKGELTLRGACIHNLKSIEATFPLGSLIGVTGVSGSGKSNLIIRTLYPALARTLNRSSYPAGPYDTLMGVEQINKVIHITQAPIGRNPRSNPGTYVGVMNEIRKIFSNTPDAKEKGFGQGDFSFNSKGGRCEACEGYGAKKIKMHLMADIWVRCDECHGKRFIPQILAVTYQDKNISEVLDMDIQEAHSFFYDNPKVKRILQTLMEVGLGYLKLGQNATTLSGGEAQRIKLAKELSRLNTGDTLYILDEPTVGLHFADIQKLIDILHRLVDSGNTVIVIEHNMDVIKMMDWIIDLGPEGGEQGGTITATGTPEEIANSPVGYTGQYLKEILGKGKI
ncbi:MAG: excinuclease ABC subunit UvrA [Chloroflexota bacterium]|nr:MAG: excinuclease ABC subunit UvrA [Chloroflexota bacterium]